MRWAYGITTVSSRLKTTLPRTLLSLQAAGFNRPRLFVDGVSSEEWARYTTLHKYEATLRQPHIRVFGNWLLGLMELYLRDGLADRFAIFQDDFLTYPNLREYLERCGYPDKGYLNLMTFPKNLKLCPRGHIGWYAGYQLGMSAVALVFNREAVYNLLTSSYLAARPADVNSNRACLPRNGVPEGLIRGQVNVDGAISHGMRNAGFVEYVHNPSLVYHIGQVSSFGNLPQPAAGSFRGEHFDCLKLLEEVHEAGRWDRTGAVANRDNVRQDRVLARKALLLRRAQRKAERARRLGVQSAEGQVARSEGVSSETNS